MANQKVQDLSAAGLVAFTDLLYLVVDPSGTPADAKLAVGSAIGAFTPSVCQFRLTTESGVPVSESDRLAQSTLYLTPSTPSGFALASGFIGFYDGTRYVVQALAQQSLDLTTAVGGSGITANTNYDVFLDYNGGSPVLVVTAWTNGTTRATALTTQGPLVVQTGNTDWRYVGTIRASATGQTTDSGGFASARTGGKRFVWNAYNQIEREIGSFDDTDSWTYSTDAWRTINSNSGNQVHVVCGLNQVIDLSFLMMAQSGAGAGNAINFGNGIGLDGTTPTGKTSEGYNGTSGAAGTSIFSLTTFYKKQVGLGYHFLAPLERVFSANSVVFYGDDGGNCQTGVSGVWKC